MTIKTLADTPTIQCCDAFDQLAVIREPSVHLAIWQSGRQHRSDRLSALDWNTIDDLSFTTPVAQIAAAMDARLADAGYPESTRAWLAEDVADLARRFADIMQVGIVALRLEVIDDDACRKFHADNVTARLLTTLVGPGTQFIEAEAPENIRQLAPGDVALFKGRRWVETPAILHRSPPIAGTNDVRLLLVIDPPRPIGD